MITLHCITLKMNPQRLNHVIEQQALWGGDFRVVEAIDGRAQSVPEHNGLATSWPAEVVRDRAARLGMTEPMNEPGKACTKGHVLLAQQQLDAIRDGHAAEGDFYLVLEDDFAFRNPKALKAFLTQVEAAGETGFDVIFLGYRGGEDRRVKAPVHRAWNQLKAALTKDPDAAAMARNEAQRWTGRRQRPLGLWAAGWHLGTHGYLMNGRAARALVEVGSSLALPADHTFRLMQAYGLALFAIAPEKFIVTKVELGSTIRSEEEFLKAARRRPTT